MFKGIKVKHKETSEIGQPTLVYLYFVGRDVLNAPLKQEDGSFLCDVNEAGEVIVDLRMRTSVKDFMQQGILELMLQNKLFVLQVMVQLLLLILNI